MPGDAQDKGTRAMVLKHMGLWHHYSMEHFVKLVPVNHILRNMIEEDGDEVGEWQKRLSGRFTGASGLQVAVGSEEWTSPQEGSQRYRRKGAGGSVEGRSWQRRILSRVEGACVERDAE